MNDKDFGFIIMTILANLYSWFPAIYLFIWFIAMTILIVMVFSYNAIQFIPWVILFALISILPIILWRLIR
mgnify:CR=1 FL=1